MRHSFRLFGTSNRLTAAATLLAIALGAGAAHAAQPVLSGLDDYVRAAMTQWKVPGLAVAVVKDGQIVVARGYGVRELGKPDRVDADTLFDIGSNTKAFTAAALGTLVAAGRLRWDDPVVEHIPGFRLDSPWVSQQITLRDLLSHRSGYCDPDMWYFSDDTTAGIIEKLRYQKPSYAFRAHFCYNNAMYLVASQFVPAVDGTTWNDFVAAHLFTPLDMTRTVSTTAAVAAASDVAIPHGEVDGKVQVIKPYWPNNMDVFAAVGGINSSAQDMSHWLIMLLANGRYHDKEIVAPSVIQAMETPQALIEGDSEIAGWLRTQTPDTRFYTYGLGLFLQDYGGHTLVWHAGDIDGMASAMALIPDEHLGVVVLSNMNENRAPEGVVFHVLQDYLGLGHRDVSRALYAYIRKEKATADAAGRKLTAARRPGTQAPLPLAEYVATYSDPFYGTAQVQQQHGHLVLRLGNPMFVGDLEHWNGSTFRVRWRYRFYDKDYVTFDIDALGVPTHLFLVSSHARFERTPARIPAANAR
jgi:CubicO group peptidase (beta-lactamase class C family)